MVNDQLLEGVLCDHEQRRTWVLNLAIQGLCSLQTSHLCTIVPDLLGFSHSEDRQALVRVQRNEDRGTDLSENVALFLESLLDVEEDAVLREVI